MKKISLVIITLIMVLCLSLASCKKKHTHSFSNGACDCGEVYEYTVKWLDNNNNILKEEKVPHGEFANAPEAPVVDGFEFVGWDIQSLPVTSDLVIKPLYQEILVIEYTINFKSNGGILEGDSEIVYTDYRDVVLPIPTREKYDFLGWYQGSQLIEKLEKNGNYTLKAEWIGKAYAINYHLDGGSFEGEYPTEYHYHENTALFEPVKEGFAFEGWYSNANFTGEQIYTITSTQEGEVDLYAKWREMNPIVTYHLNGGNWSYQSREEVVEDFLKDVMAWGGKTSKPDGMVRGAGETQVGFANVFTAVYDFFKDVRYANKWSWLRSYIIDVTPSSSATYLSKGDEAYWRYSLGAFLFEEHRNSYPASADFTQDIIANGFWETLSKYSQDEVELEDDGILATPKRIYYVFGGWYANPEFTGEPITVTNKNVEVYAKWTEEVPVESIEITNKIVEMNRFEQYQLEWIINPEDAAIKSVQFISSDENVAIVDDKGLITALNNGSVTITIKSLSPSGVTDDIYIDVTSPAHFDASYETNSYVTIGSTIKLLAEYTNVDETKTAVAWKSLNPNIATVNNGTVTGIAEGVATIRAYLINDENTYFDFVVTVLSANLSKQLEHVLNSHESNIFTRYNLGIGAGTPVYYADILGSVNKMLFNYNYEWNTKHLEDVMTHGKHSPGLDTEEYPVEFVTVHYTAGMTEGSDAEATSIFFKGAEASAHFCTGNDGIFQCLDLDVRGWHAGDGTGVKFEWYNTGVKYNESDPRWPVWGISKNSMFTLNGVETLIKTPKKEERGNEGYVTDSKWLNDQGFAFKVVDGYYYMGKTWWCYSNVWEGRICSKGGNNNSIGIESCVDYGSDLWLTWQITAQLVADLLVRYDLDITRVVGHHFYAAKDCPQPLLENDLEIWWEFIDIVEADYKSMTEFKNETFEFKVIEGSDIVNEYGRVTEQPEFTQTVTYEVKLSDGTSITLASIVPGIYTK